MIPHLSRLPLPTDLSPYLLVGSASGTTFSLASIVNHAPSGGWAGGLVAVASLAANLYLEREKRLAKEARERVSRQEEIEVRIGYHNRLTALEEKDAGREELLYKIKAAVGELGAKLDGLTAARASTEPETRRQTLRGR